MNKIDFKYTDERLITPSGLSLVGQLLGGSDIPSAETLRQMLDEIGGLLHGDILRANVEALRHMGAESSALECGYIPHDVEADTYWTSLPLPNPNVIALYHARGECEQFLLIFL